MLDHAGSDSKTIIVAVVIPGAAAVAVLSILFSYFIWRRYSTILLGNQYILRTVNHSKWHNKFKFFWDFVHSKPPVETVSSNFIQIFKLVVLQIVVMMIMIAVKALHRFSSV